MSRKTYAGVRIDKKKSENGKTDRRELLKKNMRWSRLVELLINFLSILVMVMAGAFAIAREISWPFILIAAVECPLWVIAAKKLFWEDKPVLGWIVRGALLVGGYVLLSVSTRFCVYNRCHPSVTQETFQKQFEEEKESGTEFQSLGEIESTIKGDYTELKTVAFYKNTGDGSAGERELTLYFDRRNGRYYGSVEDMEKYRQQVRDMGIHTGEKETDDSEK